MATRDWTALDYAKWAGVPIYNNMIEWGNDGQKTPCIVRADNKEDTPVFFPDEHGSLEWTDKTWLGRTVIAAVCMESEKWPSNWMVWPGHGVVEHENWQKQDRSSLSGVAINGVRIGINATCAEAVLAAVRSVGK